MAKFAYYENGKEDIYTLPQVKILFRDLVDDTQKSQGTTFEMWLCEMKKMQIFSCP